MGLEYLSYLAGVLLGTLALLFFFKKRLDGMRAITAILPVALLFIAWDALAVHFNHWSFSPSALLGVFVGNQPVEEIAFFFVVPLFYVTIWEITKSRAKA